MDVTSHIHAHKTRREKSQGCRSESFEERSGREDCSYIGAKKSRKAVICPLIVIYCDPRATRADDRTFACEIGDGIRA